MFHVLIAAWACVCIAYLACRIPSTLKARNRSDGPARIVAKARIHGQVASLVVAITMLGLEGAHFIGDMSDRTFARSLIVGIVAASMSQMVSAELGRWHLRKKVRDEARSRIYPQNVIRLLEGGTGNRTGQGREEDPSQQDRQG